ncbi:MAG: potassium transporter KtrB [Ruminococcaceae bacterium]|nr:potassium transporter KtrB [Oscillospiraceae bacterium]
MKKIIYSLSTTQIIMIGFAVVILVGSLLLMLPVSSANGNSVSFVDSLFTATTSTCVTGLVTLPTVSTWSTFGHIVIICLIQVGGLGVITIMSGIMLMFHKRMGIRDRILIQDAFNLNTMSGLVRFVKKVFLGTFIIEGLGAAICMIRFVPMFGIKGVWYSIFHSISAFCNAGIDIISENSLCEYATDPLINIVTCVLIVFGGIGYIVWWDVISVIKERKKMRSLTLHSKIALVSTVIIIISGAVLFFVFEYNNPLSMGNASVGDKVQMSLFQSITTRTAGFATIPQENLTNSSSILSLILMFIGGSPVGTAGGIKTVTFVILIFASISAVKNRNEVVLFNRNIPKYAINKALSVVFMSFGIMFVSTLLLSFVTDSSVINILYETVSATATVGLTRNLTPFLNVWGKIIIIFTMFFGRVGPISLAVALNVKKENPNKIKNPVEDICVG